MRRWSTRSATSRSRTARGRPGPRPALLGLAVLGCSAAVLAQGGAALPPEARANRFGDPFLQVTDGRPGCPVPAGPALTEAEMRAEAHGRAERGTSCYRAGRCRLPNAYLYDREIIPRVRQAVLADGRFAGTSLWVEGQRRWVWLKGCVGSAAEADALERLVRGIDDVEAVVNQLQIAPDAPH